jgi:hypothetical protein
MQMLVFASLRSVTDIHRTVDYRFTERFARSPVVRASLIASLLLVAIACTTIAPFSQVAYEQATSLKVESLSLMDKAVDPYQTHKAEVETLRLKIAKAYEYAKGRPLNTLSTSQWEVLMNPSRSLLGGFLARWEREAILTATFIEQAKGIVSDAFDTISALESGKTKASDVK